MAPRTCMHSQQHIGNRHAPDDLPGSGRQWARQPVVVVRLMVMGIWGPVSCINAFAIHGLPAYSSHMRPDIVLHQEEPRDHCTSVRSGNHSEEIIPVSHRVHAGLQGHASPDHYWPTTKLVILDVTGSLTFTMVSPDSFTCAQCEPFTSVKRIGIHSRPANSGVVWEMLTKLCSAGLWAQVILKDVGLWFPPPTWSQFLIVWSETSTQVACWMSLAVLVLLFLAQRSRNWFCCWVVALLQPCPGDTANLLSIACLDVPS